MRQENPVFWYHLLGQSRYRWRKQRAMTIIASVLIGLLYLYLLQQTLEYEVEPILIQLLGLLLICLLIPLGSYSLFSAEYEKATWESLAITPLTVDQIVFGKWFSRVLGCWSWCCL
jgi:ABC-type transport system involved in multi-copper enzyme maturation permease subunit